MKKDLEEKMKAFYESYEGKKKRPRVVFPVDLMFEDGSSLTVNSVEEMKQAWKDNCRKRWMMKSLKETKELEDNSLIIFIKKGYFKLALFCFGAVAQLGERVDGIHEVVGSIPSGSTK